MHPKFAKKYWENGYTHGMSKEEKTNKVRQWAKKNPKWAKNFLASKNVLRDGILKDVIPDKKKDDESGR